jgi:hypothetical protein
VQNAGTVQFYSYVPNDDSDGDGVSNTATHSAGSRCIGLTVMATANPMPGIPAGPSRQHHRLTLVCFPA